MFEVWYESGRTRKVVARFRLLRDAEKYLAQHDGDASLAIVPAPTESAPRSRTSGAVSTSAAESSHPPKSSAPANSSAPPKSSAPPESSARPNTRTPPRSGRGASSVPPDSEGRERRHSGVHGRVRGEVTGAAEHPDEFIADQAGTGDSANE